MNFANLNAFTKERAVSTKLILTSSVLTAGLMLGCKSDPRPASEQFTQGQKQELVCGSVSDKVEALAARVEKLEKEKASLDAGESTQKPIAESEDEVSRLDISSLLGYICKKSVGTEYLRSYMTMAIESKSLNFISAYKAREDSEILVTVVAYVSPDGVVNGYYTSSECGAEEYRTNPNRVDNNKIIGPLNLEGKKVEAPGANGCIVMTQVKIN